MLNCRCYFCAKTFILPQELSRHIRDKVCKTDEKPPSAEVCDETDSLNPISLLELPIITDISNDVEVTKLIVTSQNDASTSVDSTAVESLVQENYMIIEHGTDLDLDERQHHSKDIQAGPSSGNEHKILWGCKQCEFR